MVVCEPLNPDDIQRMEEDRDFQGVNSLEDREERRIGQLSPSNVCAKVDTAAAELCHGPVHFSDSGLRILEGKSCQRHETVRMESAGRSQRVVDESRQAEPKSVICPVDHRRHERESLDCYTLGVHRPQPEVEIVVVRGDGANRDLANQYQGSIRTGAEAHPASLPLQLDNPKILLRNKMGVNVDCEDRVPRTLS